MVFVAPGLVDRKVWLIAQPWVILDDVLKATAGGQYVSLTLVSPDWAHLGSYREIGDARAHNDLLDDRTRHHRINPWGCRYPHVFAPDK